MALEVVSTILVVAAVLFSPMGLLSSCEGAARCFKEAAELVSINIADSSLLAVSGAILFDGRLFYSVGLRLVLALIDAF